MIVKLTKKMKRARQEVFHLHRDWSLRKIEDNRTLHGGCQASYAECIESNNVLKVSSHDTGQAKITLV